MTPTEAATELRSANDEVLSLVEGCSEDDWRQIVPGEGWPVAVVMHHVASGHGLVAEWIESARRGDDITTSAAEIDAANARHAEEFAEVSREATAELLRANGAALDSLIAGLTEDEMANEVGFAPAGGALFSTEQLCGAAAGHVRSHLGHVKEVLGISAG
jgi:hypothetical protein